MLTKIHFKAIAKIIKDRHRDTNDTAVKYGIEFITDDLADYFMTLNPKFDKELFLEACFSGVD